MSDVVVLTGDASRGTRPKSLTHSFERRLSNMKLPGFTADAVLSDRAANYRANAAASVVSKFGQVTLALDNDPKLGYVDCKEWPNNLFCRECGATGPDSAICCPNNYCIINNPPEERGHKFDFRSVMGNVGFLRR
jgi:hypothetical protein